MTWFDAALEKLKLDGPIRGYITEEEYQALIPYIRQRWTGHFSWTKEARLMLLGYLRAYTFYRELSEHEDQFWANFHHELGLERGTPTNAQYDELWFALKSNEETAPICIENHRREFVKTIDAIWGIRSPKAKQLVQLFLAYYREHTEEVITPELIRRLVPDADESALRQAAAYDRVFRSLVHAVDFILDHDLRIEGMPPDDLVKRFEQFGLILGQPNPVWFLHNKTSQALPTIIAELRDESRWRSRKQPSKGGTRSAAKSIRRDIHLKLLEQKHGFPFVQVIPTRHQGILIEGQMQAGEVVLPDGRFQTFRWRPRLGERMPIRVTFEEGEVIAFEIEAKCLALHFRDRATGEVLQSLLSLNPNHVECLLNNPYSRVWKLRYSLSSDPFIFEASFDKLIPRVQDQLLVEICTDQRSDRWQPLARIPVAVKPRFEVCDLVRDVLRVVVCGPKVMRLQVIERVATSSLEMTQELEPKNGVPMPIQLKHPAVFQSINLDVRVEAGGFSEERSMIAPPRLSLDRALQYGIGWGWQSTVKALKHH